MKRYNYFDRNAGMGNSGKDNTGNRNSGYSNSGNSNSGNWNSGNSNSGDNNTNHWNSGNRNSGNSNSGMGNSGNWNSGNSNSGDRNSGNWNSGDWNSCNNESGFFNSTNSDTVRVFNKECSREKWENAKKPWFIFFDLTEGVEDSTNPEKWYLKTYKYKEAWRLAWDTAKQKKNWKEEYNKLINLPNFDPDIFEEITGINIKEGA